MLIKMFLNKKSVTQIQQHQKLCLIVLISSKKLVDASNQSELFQ